MRKRFARRVTSKKPSTSLRRAMELDPKNRDIRESLVNALIGQAQPLMDVDWRAAEPLIQQATDLDQAHAGARSLRTLMVDIKRKEFVSHCLAEARDLQAAGDMDGAIAKVDAGLALYPNETRLGQLQTTLRNVLHGMRGAAKSGRVIVEALRAIRAKSGAARQRRRNGHADRTIHVDSAKASGRSGDRFARG